MRAVTTRAVVVATAIDAIWTSQSVRNTELAVNSGQVAMCSRNKRQAIVRMCDSFLLASDYATCRCMLLRLRDHDSEHTPIDVAFNQGS